MYMLVYLIDCKENVVIPAIWVEHFDAEVCFNHGINRNKVYKIFFSNIYKSADFMAPLRTVLAKAEDATYRAKLCRMKFSKEAAQLKASKRRRVEPFTCSDFPDQEPEHTEALKLISERTLLTPINTTTELIRYQVKTEMELVRMEEQIGNLLRHIPIIEMGNILEEVFTIDVEDDHTYDERFAAFFGLNQMIAVKQEQEPIDETDEMPVVGNHPSIAIVGHAVPLNNAMQRPTVELFSPAFANSTSRQIELSNNEHDDDELWLIDLTIENCEMGGSVYDDRFAKYFGLQRVGIKQDSSEISQIPQLTGSSFEDDQNDCLTNNFGFSENKQFLINCKDNEITQSSGSVLEKDQQATPPLRPDERNIAIRDPISHDHQFETDILGNRHYPLWNVTIPFKVVNTLVSYNSFHQDVFHDRLFVQVLVLGSLEAGGTSTSNGNIMQAAQSLFHLRTKGDANRMGRFHCHIESLRKILQSKLLKK